MGKRTLKPAAPAIDEDEDLDLDEEVGGSASIDDDDDDDLWDADDDEPATATALECVYCQCTEDNACVTVGGPCSWISNDPPVCSALDCVEAFDASKAENGEGDEVEAANPPITEREETAPDDAPDDGTWAPSEASSLQVQYVSRSMVHPDPEQPRQHADAELRDSIAALGILQPISVRPMPGQRGEYLIVDGERRWQGSEGVLEMIPVLVRGDQVDAYDRLRTQLVANTGKPLTPIEEARTFARMLESRDVGIAALARDVGRPASTVHDRVKLLELGPWLPLVDAGTISTSMAVTHLVPLRGVPDEFHQQAIEKAMEGLKAGEPIAETVEQFGRTTRDVYKSFMYPLAKSKGQYDKQPEFNTKDHDAECECGGIEWRDGWDGGGKPRRHCGNPTWWKPLHTAAMKKAREKEKASGAAAPAKKGDLRLELPAGTPTISIGYNRAPKGVVVLTDQDGKWKTSESRWDLDDAFDPADLVIDEKKLVRLKAGYGLDRVGTKDVAAVDAAREAWAKRFAPAREKAGAKLLQEFEKLRGIYSVTGAGVHSLLGTFDLGDSELAEIGDLLGIPVPKDIERDANHRTTARVSWFAKSIGREDAERMTSFLAFLSGDKKRELPSKTIEESQRAAFDEVAKKRAPWATTRAPKKAGAK